MSRTRGSGLAAGLPVLKSRRTCLHDASSSSRPLHMCVARQRYPPGAEFDAEFFMIRSWIDHVTELEYHQLLQPARTAGVA